MFEDGEFERQLDKTMKQARFTNFVGMAFAALFLTLFALLLVLGIVYLWRLL